MDMEQLRKVADLLGVYADPLRLLPENFQERLFSKMVEIEVRDAFDLHRQYDEVEEIWLEGTTFLNLMDIAEDTGISLDKLLGLEQNEKLNIIFEYSLGTDKALLIRMVDDH